MFWRGLSTEEERDLVRKLEMTGEQVFSQFIRYRAIDTEEAYWFGPDEAGGPVEAIIPLETAAAVSTATLDLEAPTQVPLGTAAAQSAATLALAAPTQVPLATAAAQSTATLTLTAPATLVLSSGAAQSAGTLALTAPTQVPLATAAAQSSATLALTAPALLRLSAITYPSEVLADSPVGYWRFGDLSGTTATDSSGNARPGTYVGTPTLGATGSLNADPDTAVTFSGAAGQHVDVPHDAAFALTTNYTLECWVKPTDRAGIYYLITKDLTATPRPYEWRLTATTGRPALFPGGGQGTNGPATGVWSHIAVTFDGTTHRHYLNGVENGTAAGTTTTDGGGVLRIATRDDLNNGFKGGLDEVAIYNTVLSPTRIKAHYDAGIAVSCAAQSAATLSVTVPGVATVPLDPAAAVSTGTLALTAQTQIPLGTAAAQSAGTLALTAQTRIALGTSAAVSTATLALTAATKVVLATSAAQSAATAFLTAQTYIPLGTSTAQSAATLVVTIPGGPPTPVLETATATSNATLAVTAKTQVPLGTAAVTSTGTLAVTAKTAIALQTSVALSTGTLSVFAPTAALLILGAANANSTATLALGTQGNRWPPHTNPRWDVDPETRWQPAGQPHWAPVGAGRWDIDPQNNW